MNDSISVMRGS